MPNLLSEENPCNSIKYFTNKFEDVNALNSNLLKIRDLFVQYQIRDHFKNIIIDGISWEIELFQTGIIYGPDLWLQSYIKDKEFWSKMNTHTEKILHENKGEITEKFLIRR